MSNKKVLFYIFKAFLMKKDIIILTASRQHAGDHHKLLTTFFFCLKTADFYSSFLLALDHVVGTYMFMSTYGWSDVTVSPYYN